MNKNVEQALQNYYKTQKEHIKTRLNDFKTLKKQDYFKEFLFCLLTPQSNAKKCWEAVEQLSKLPKLTQQSVLNILKTRTRFHNNKARYVLQAEETYRSIVPLLENPDKTKTRNQIADCVMGYGLKEASHFLRNIGKSDNKLAILDRHILRNLKEIGIIKEDKLKTKSDYLNVEQRFLNLANSLNIPPDELDLLFWSKENGEVFK